MFKLIFILLFSLSSGLASATTLVQSQCEMLAQLSGEMTAREIKGEAYEKYIPELFPRFEKFPEDLQLLLLTIPRVIKEDFKRFPEFSTNPQAHADAVLEFCVGTGGEVSEMQNGFESFLAQR